MKVPSPEYCLREFVLYVEWLGHTRRGVQARLNYSPHNTSYVPCAGIRRPRLQTNCYLLNWRYQQKFVEGAHPH